MKRMLVLLLAVTCLCIGATALAEEKERETVTLGTKGQLVVRIQQRLMDLGYYTYKPTGSYQAVTRRAAMAYERAANVRQDGRLTPEEQDGLFSTGATRAPYVANVPLSFTAQTASFVTTGELWDWSEIKTQLTEGEAYTVSNCATGESCQLVFQGGENHAHMIPATQYTNGQMLKKWMGESNSYYKIAVTVQIEDKRIAASLQYDNTTAHVYFQGSTSHVLNMADVEHDRLVQRAAGR
jgi:peptidoglycan hydrolase-like protein with peptidoglycan-binding domain